MVPESAIVPRGGETFVFRIESGKAAETRVKVGERRNGEVEVLEGLLADTAVVTAGQQKLRNGSDVEIFVSGGRDKPPADKRRS
jgi:membrane fusion protein (multidrug efflux system)